MSTLNSQNWLDRFDMPVLISGPCSAESEEQIMKTADQMDFSRVNIFRAGIWKPRTKPGSFEGIGREGLKWLQQVKKKHNVLVATEVATREHVKEALEHDIDVLWIGARTSVNPFIVQEIADTLEGEKNKIILVKNPINPDLPLWIGALERLDKKGIKNLGVIHRGFSTFEKSQYRNKPTWQIPLELKKLLPNVPIITDPSHICGSKEFLFDISQQSYNLGFDGLMIESHYDPSIAKSDAEQQITPSKLKELISQIVLRNDDSEDTTFKSKIQVLRNEIDDLDMNLLNLLSHRMEISEKIGELKAEDNIAVFQSSRWIEIIEKMKAKANKLGLSDEFVDIFFKSIHDESIRKQNEVLRKNQK